MNIETGGYIIVIVIIICILIGIRDAIGKPVNGGRFSQYLLWDFSGIRWVWEKIKPPQKGSDAEKNPPSTFVLWASGIFGLYIALFGLTSQRYENRIDVIEYRANSILAQLGTDSHKKALSRIPIVQNMSCPTKPLILRPSTVIESLFQESIYDEMVLLLKETLENWKNSLDGIDLNEAILIEAQLQNAKLQETMLYRANLQKANLDHANLEGAHLVQANLQGASLWNADLQNVYLHFADLRNADLPEADLRMAKFQFANLERANLKEADLQSAEFGGATRKREIFYAELKGVDPGGSNRGSNLQWADLTDANLQEASFEGANLRRAFLREANLQDANLSMANLHGVGFENAKLQNAYFYGADLQKARLNKANLRHANLKNTKNLNVEQLCETISLYHTILPSDLEKQVREKCPQLLEDQLEE